LYEFFSTIFISTAQYLFNVDYQCILSKNKSMDSCSFYLILSWHSPQNTQEISVVSHEFVCTMYANDGYKPLNALIN
jgi:hypothetical protein